jgi:hypothetical protein
MLHTMKKEKRGGQVKPYFIPVCFSVRSKTAKLGTDNEIKIINHVDLHYKFKCLLSSPTQIHYETLRCT